MALDFSGKLRCLTFLLFFAQFSTGSTAPPPMQWLGATVRVNSHNLRVAGLGVVGSRLVGPRTPPSRGLALGPKFGNYKSRRVVARCQSGCIFNTDPGEIVAGPHICTELTYPENERRASRVQALGGKIPTMVPSVPTNGPSPGQQTSAKIPYRCHAPHCNSTTIREFILRTFHFDHSETVF